MREAEIEAYLRKRVDAMGGKAYKFVSPGNVGVPDRMIVFTGGKIIFAELKAPGKPPGLKQLLQQGRLRDFGFIVYGCVDSKAAVDAMLREVMSR